MLPTDAHLSTPGMTPPTFRYGRLVEKAALLVLMGVLGFASFKVVGPFVTPFLWAIIISLSTWPYYLKVVAWFRGRRSLAATALTLAMLAGFVVPLVYAFQSVADSLPFLNGVAREISTLHPTEPPAWAANIPVFGDRLDSAWRQCC